MKLDTYIHRYWSLLQSSIESYPSPTTFACGRNEPNTHCVRLRQVKKLLVDKPNKIPTLLSADDFTKLSLLNFWYVDDIVYMGDRKSWDPSTGGLVSPLLPSTTSSSPSLNLPNPPSPLSPSDIQALFYCYSRQLFSLPTKLDNPTPDIIAACKSFAPKCPTVGCQITPTYIIIL